ncbi:hypothetical protein K440DRAFT_641108 [Wilcoxina mikolae CBS 423.85]|nr:hypothetical protein K440DRAFT_641108 [Wilcoxina mikolae CBS 423.85]
MGKTKKLLPHNLESTIIDEAGDVILIASAGKKERKFLVSSTILCLASPVFRTMLGTSHFKEGLELQKHKQRKGPEGRFELKLEDDSPDAMETILNAIHLRGEDVPMDPPEKHVIQIVTICEKYDLSVALLPWSPHWINVMPLEEANRLFASCAFKCAMEFSKASRKLVLECKIEAGGLYTPGGTNLKTVENIPQNVSGK